VGGSIERQATDINAPFQWGGVWTFGGLQAFLQKTSPPPSWAPCPDRTTPTGSSASGRDNVRAGRVESGVDADADLGLRYAPTTNATVAPGITLVDPPRSPAFTPVDTVFATNASLKTSTRGSASSTIRSPITGRRFALASACSTT